MQELRSRTTAALLGFAWDQWAELGVSSSHGKHDRTAADPEALLVFTLQIARHEPRLYDEVLDWLTVNGDLLSARRLTRLTEDVQTRRLVAAAVGWAARHGSPLRVSSTDSAAGEPELLFPALRPPPEPDEMFLRHGYLKALTMPSGKSRRVDTASPVAFAFRLRQVLGVGTRAEIVRFLLTSGVPRATTLAIAEDAASTKRNVNSALADLTAAGVLVRITTGNTAWFGLDRGRWATFLGLDETLVPGHRDWARLLRSAATIVGWLHSPSTSELDSYLRASEARRLIAPLVNQLHQAGVPVFDEGLGAEYWTSFARTVDSLVQTITRGGGA